MKNLTFTQPKHYENKMRSAKEIFLEAARNGTAIHIGVHWEIAMMNQLIFASHVKNAWSQARLLANTVSPHIPSLYTTLSSNPTMPMGDKDRYVMHDNFSAIANREHTEFIDEHGINVGLISGIAATKCVKITKEACDTRGIIPIMVTDATDLCDPAERVWGKDCLKTTVAEVQEWVKEL